jgi:hypothetical protein
MAQRFLKARRPISCPSLDSSCEITRTRTSIIARAARYSGLVIDRRRRRAIKIRSGRLCLDYISARRATTLLLPKETTACSRCVDIEVRVRVSTLSTYTRQLGRASGEVIASPRRARPPRLDGTGGRGGGGNEPRRRRPSST